VRDANDLKLSVSTDGNVNVAVGGALTVQAHAANLLTTSGGNTVFEETRVTGDLNSVSTAGSILQAAPVEVLGKTEMQADVAINLPMIGNNLVNGFNGVAPSVNVVGDRMGEAAAAAAAAAAATASAGKVSVTAEVSSVAPRPGLSIAMDAPTAVSVQSQGGGLVVASVPASVPAQAKVSVELMLSPVAPVATSAGAAPSAVAASSAGTGSTVVSNANFVQVRSFDPLVVPAASAFSFVLPGDAFVHKDEKVAVSVSAQTSQGDKLPDWLSFSPAEKRFSGVAPQGVTSFEVMVKATDASGAEVSTTIKLEFSSTAGQK
jgi:hypothetical protein